MPRYPNKPGNRHASVKAHKPPPETAADRDDAERKKAEFIQQHGVRKLPARKGEM